MSAEELIGGYEVHTCIGIARVMLNDLPAVDDEVFDRVHVGPSLQHCVTEECLRRSDGALHRPHPGDSMYALGD